MDLLSGSFFLLLAVISGAFFPIQAGVNSQLTGWTKSPVVASAVSFIVGTVSLLAYILISRISLPDFSHASSQNWWLWTGGLMGAFAVTVMIFLAQRLGALSLLSCVLAGQMIAAVILDHYGLFGYPQQPVNLYKIFGILFIIAGVFLIKIK